MTCNLCRLSRSVKGLLACYRFSRWGSRRLGGSASSPWLASRLYSSESDLLESESRQRAGSSRA